MRLDGRQLLAAGDEHGAVVLWDPAGLTRVAEFAAATGGHPVNALTALEPDGLPRPAVGHGDGTVRLLDATAGPCRAAPPAPGDAGLRRDTRR
ncbi:hypothetical protein [Kitasatospora sp. KL5]|uniref:hypothetical protein n=1 Tax=Kitasatospora sp. KL5 TaxID=3425125 RepID=UPI003D6FD7CE